MTKEEIVQNIKTRISTIESYRPEEYALNKGILFELKDLLSMIEKEKPSLPSNLDEAVEEFGKRQGLELAPFAKKFFKAGAKWMSEQGVIYEDTISSEKTIPVLPMKDVSDMGLDYGDKVIVQIRKKQ